MSAEIVVTVISAVAALTSVYIGARTTQRATLLSQQFDLAKSRATKEQQVEELMSRYREPLLRASFDLQSRIYNIIKNGFLTRYGAQGREHERWYAHDNTVFLFAEYFGWVEILRRDVQFLDLGDVERNRLLVERLDAISETFASDRKIADPSFRVFRGNQRAFGELMIAASTASNGASRLQCIGYAGFRSRLGEDPAFQEWFRPLCDDVSALIEGATAGDYERLTKLQRALVDLILFLDDPPSRFPRDCCTKL